MKIQIELNTDNAAFEDDPNEVERILRKALDSIIYEYVPRISLGIHAGELVFVMTDWNGNRVGKVSVTNEEVER